MRSSCCPLGNKTNRATGHRGSCRFALVGLRQISVSKPPEIVLSHQQLHDPLLTIRGANRVCHGDSEQCKRWTVLMLDCEQGTADRCQEAEDLRKQASGVATDSEPEAYAF